MARLFALVCLLAAGALAQPVTVAAASSLGPPLRAIIARYQHRGGEPVRLVLASSGKLYGQIRSGAPYDLYLPAANRYRKNLEVRAAKVLARGVMALYFPPHTGIAAQDLGQLTDPRIRRIAIANPRFAPYGAAAVAALKAKGLWTEVRKKLVYGESVAQAARMAAFAADAGLIDLGSARQLPGSHRALPLNLYPPIAYPALLLSDRPEARAFFAFLSSEEAQEVLFAYGLRKP